MIVLGGLHASMNYREAVRHCDYVLLGEGDETILFFCGRLRGKSPWILQGLLIRRRAS